MRRIAWLCADEDFAFIPEANMVGPGSIFMVVVSLLASLVTLITFTRDIVQRTSEMPLKAGFSGLNVILHLAILTAISFGLLWTAAQKAFGWKYGAGGRGILPYGIRAVILSLGMTLSLVFVPALYQMATGITVLLPAHWKGSIFVILGGACTYVLLFGTSKKPNGLRHWLIPNEKKTPGFRGFVQEALYTTFVVGFILLPYRLVVNPGEPLSHMIVGRIVLPWAVYFLGMSIFISVNYPETLRDRTWIQLRGVVAGLLVMFCLCGAMFS